MAVAVAVAVAVADLAPNESISVSSIYIYPVKGCKGISLPHALVCSTGFRWDRQWMVVGKTGRMLTQRVEPKLALVEVLLSPDAVNPQWGPLSSDSALSLTAPGMESLRIPLNIGKFQRNVIQVSVWEWTGLALDEGGAAANWFSKYLQKPCRLVRFDPDQSTRPTDKKFANGYQTTFTDGYPFLLVSEASMDALNEHLKDPLPINRFRPSIIVQGSTPFAEDYWQTFLIGNLKFHGVKLCSRCKVTTTDQETGEVGQEPLVTLRTFRNGQLLSSVKNMKNQVYFGQNIVCENSFVSSIEPRPIVAIGDKICVLEKAPAISTIMSKE
ncbi:hypothetical protein O6H91_01G159500 [Diphasiastrum complanatum]|uniref:Uncharacterized protein n=1 Tax=Diphasiastrum complanatum TaxID=34168 RepID=A0ACC2EY85_DIPCM|nr:hypothetical protein O6H91_01G159500 [Diphasiastrum complanatum]